MPTESLQTQKFPALSQLIVCTGGSCLGKKRPDGDTEPQRKKALLDAWKKDYLWRVCHISFSDCLGPCDLACNALLLTAEGSTWLGNLQDEHFTLLTAWVQASQQAGQLLPLPAELQPHQAQRFAEAGTFTLTRQRRTE